MNKLCLFDPIRILFGPQQKTVISAVLIKDNRIQAFGDEARIMSHELGLNAIPAEKLLFAPCLVDPHSFLETPINGKTETLQSLVVKATSAGYGQIALLPKSNLWRDQPEYLHYLPERSQDVLIHLWAGFSQEGKGKELSSHKDLIKYGAIGLADDDFIIPPELLKKGLMLNEAKGKPILVAPRDKNIKGKGVVRECIEALRSGFQPDPVASETLPLGTLLELHKQHPDSNIRLMNLSTCAGVSMLEKCLSKPMASVCWWHLVADQSTISYTDIGMNVSPSIGSFKDRKSLKNALRKKTLTGVSVHSISLDEIESSKPLAYQIPGLSGYHLVLPALWNELIQRSNWSIEELWDAISFGPSRMLNSPIEKLIVGSNRWLLFDPEKKWVQTKKYSYVGCKTTSNQPWEGITIRGKIISCGLNS